MNKEVRITKRIGSIALVVCIILTSLVFSPAVSALDSLEFEDFANIYGAHINFNSKISVKGDGNNTSYVLDVDVYSSYSAHTSNVNILTSKDDYYVVDKPGYYLFELWGANGGDSTGKGGAGGYVYGVMRLEEGQILYYTLGGEGGKINKPGESGGANGGGGYGDSSTTTVGGGGGYSAIYLFDKTDFEEKYLNSDGNLKSSISDSDRSSKYIMIAGGGGGGGSYGADSSGTPDGGAGGYIGSASGDLVDGYDVSGTFFAGIDGFSSGTSTQYVGKGGTNVPGSIVSSLGNGDSTEQPNDWKGTYNSDLVGGAGGAGNLRGGGGGGGFCGGSGGIQRSSWLASNIGGGGGGSSFVSSQVTYKPQAIAALENDLGARAEEMMIGIENGKGGGEMHLVFLEEQDDAYLKKMDISFARTP